MEQVISLQYCTLTTKGKVFSDKIEIRVDFGSENSIVSHYDQALVAATKKVEQLYNLADTLNYLHFIGWELVQAIPLDINTAGTTGVRQYVFHRRLQA